MAAAHPRSKQRGITFKNQTARGHPTLNAHVPQDNGTYEANEKQDLSTS
jgi:hypothetical protein